MTSVKESAKGIKIAAPVRMTKEQMAIGFCSGRILIQEEWANPLEIKWVNELVVEGKAIAGPWEYSDDFQCERRRITGIKQQ